MHFTLRVIVASWMWQIWLSVNVHATLTAYSILVSFFVLLLCFQLLYPESYYISSTVTRCSYCLFYVWQNNNTLLIICRALCSLGRVVHLRSSLQPQPVSDGSIVICRCQKKHHQPPCCPLASRSGLLSRRRPSAVLTVHPRNHTTSRLKASAAACGGWSCKWCHNLVLAQWRHHPRHGWITAVTHNLPIMHKKRLNVESLLFVLASTLRLSSSSSSPSLPTHMQLHPTYYPNIHTYTHPKPPRQCQSGGGGRWEAYKRVRDFRGRAEETSSKSHRQPPTTTSCTFCRPLHPGRSERLTHSLAHVHSPHPQRCERLLWQQLRSVVPALLSPQHAAPGGFSGSDGGCVQRESSRHAPSGRQEPRPHQQGEHHSSLIVVFIFEKLAQVLGFHLWGFFLYPEEFHTMVCQKQDVFPCIWNLKKRNYSTKYIFQSSLNSFLTKAPK